MSSGIGNPMASTMQPHQLSITDIFRHGQRVYAGSEVATFEGESKDELTTVEHFVVVGEGDASALGDVLRYETLLAGAEASPEWPSLDEAAAAAMCYTSGTTGHPRASCTATARPISTHLPPARHPP